MFAASYDGLMRSDDSGKTWKKLAAVGAKYHITDLAVSYASPPIVYAGTEKGVYKSTDGGYSWQPINNGLPGQGRDLLIDEVATHPDLADTVYAASGNQVFASANAGTTWIPLGALPDQTRVSVIWSDRGNPHRLIVGTYKNGLWAYNIE